MCPLFGDGTAGNKLFYHTWPTEEGSRNYSKIFLSDFDQLYALYQRYAKRKRFGLFADVYGCDVIVRTQNFCVAAFVFFRAEIPFSSVLLLCPQKAHVCSIFASEKN